MTPTQNPAAKSSVALWLLLLAAFLTPIIGGSLYVEITSLAPGPGALLQSVFHGTDTPQAQYLLITTLLALGLGLTLLRGRVLSMPSGAVSTLLLVLLALLALSVFSSVVKLASLQSLLNWSAYLLGFFAMASALGRVRGPALIVTAIVAGCAIVAFFGILEWGQVKAVDPTWRIFGGWNNPNALAGALMVGLILSCGLVTTVEGPFSILAFASTILIGLALFLTQSRGGILAAGLGVIVTIIGIAASQKPVAWSKVGGVAGALAVTVVLIGLAMYSTRSAGGGVGSRLTTGSASSEQSSGFRTLLWKSSAALIKQSPTGTGLSSFSVVSTRPGLITQTLDGHSNLLQLGVEATVLAPLALLAATILCLWKGFRAPRQEPNHRILGWAVRAALLALLFDGVFESNLYFFGTGLLFFMLLGLSLQFTADSVSPELATPPLKASLLIGCAIMLFGQGYFAGVEILKARAHYDRDNDPSSFSSDIDQLKSFAPSDPETHYLAAFQGTLSASEREHELEQALALGPTSKIARALALSQTRLGRLEDGARTLEHALITDPNNLSTLTKLLDTQVSNSNFDEADRVANRMVDIETQPIFTIRSIPELVPLQTTSARRYLAKRARNRNDTREEAKQLDGAVAIYKKFATTTIPNLIDNIKRNGPQYKLADESADVAHGHLEEAHQVAAELAGIYRELGDTAGVERATRAGEEFLAAEAALAEALSPSK